MTMLSRHHLARSIATLFVILAILGGIYALWQRYQVDPVTRDGKVRADMVPVSADVAGLVTEVRVVDNQSVRKGDVLFVVDRPRYQLALEQAEATLMNKRASLSQSVREDRRNSAVREVIAAETVEQGLTRTYELRAEVAQAVAARNLARFNLERTLVRAPVDGVVTNTTLQPGVYVVVGKPALALVYGKTLRVEGYFEETKLPAIQVGDQASIYIMGVADEIHGRVHSIAGGIEDRERGGTDGQYADVKPSFDWVRLPQRIPVRIEIESKPANVRLIPGQTATVVIHPRADAGKIHRSLPW